MRVCLRALQPNENAHARLLLELTAEGDGWTDDDDDDDDDGIEGGRYGGRGATGGLGRRGRRDLHR